MRHVHSAKQIRDECWHLFAITQEAKEGAPMPTNVKTDISKQRGQAQNASACAQSSQNIRCSHERATESTRNLLIYSSLCHSNSKMIVSLSDCLIVLMLYEPV